MKRSFLIPAIVISLFCLIGCKGSKKSSAPPPSVVAAFTSGSISSASDIKVIFTVDIASPSTFDKPLGKSPISFKPSIKGTTVWRDKKTLVFTPEARLKSGQEYTATLDVNSIIHSKVKKEPFTFSFRTIRQAYEISFNGLQSVNDENLTVQQYSGLVTTADIGEIASIEKIVTAKQNGKSLSIIWNHTDNTHHAFTVDSIIRSENEETVAIEWNGKPIGVDMKGSDNVKEPSLSSFIVNDIKPVRENEQYIEIRFSDPLKKQQNLNGLISVSNDQDLRFEITGSIVKVFTKNSFSGTVDVTVRTGVKNSMGRNLKEEKNQSFTFEESNPEIKFVGNGVIFPTTDGVSVPIQAINVRAVIVEARQIFDQNISQFMQVNNLGGKDELRRVARLVWKKRVNLNFTPEKANRWITYGLDCTPLVKKFPGGMFRLKVYFEKNMAAYKCEGAQDAADVNENYDLETVNEFIADSDEKETSSWDYAEEYYGEGEGEGEGESNQYQERNNPCSDAYYKYTNDHSITVERNVLISDIGIIAKKGNNDTVSVVLSDLKTAQPISGGNVTVLGFEQDTLASGSTNGDGIVSLRIGKREPFMVIARNNNQHGYLRLMESDALSVSQFDVSGERIEKGLKGLIYGERGVWRPGDTLFLTFVLNDIQNPLPPGHPVSLELTNARGQKVTTVRQLEGTNGFYVFKIPTQSDAPTGNWNAEVKVGGATFSKQIKVESIMPNRLKINLDIGNRKYLSEGAVDMELSSTWLHGAIASNLKCEVEVSYVSIPTQFSKFTDYIFNDPIRTYEPQSEEIFSGELDENGKASINANLSAQNVAPGMLQANFVTRVYENSGTFSTDRFSKPFHPYETYIGIRVPKGDKARGMLLTDTLHTVDIAALTRDEQAPKSTKVEIALYQIEWRWWWEKGPENLGQYNEETSHTAIQKDTVTVLNGQGSWSFKVKYPSWGRYLIRARDINGGHASGKIVYIDWPGWAGRAQNDGSGSQGAASLYFSADKSSYAVGEEVAVSIPTATSGRGLISIENGGRVLKSDWIEGKEGTTKYTFKATPEMAPNVYVNVTYLQPHMQTKNDLPIRMYGVIPVMVSDPETHLTPEIKCKDSFEPQSEQTIEISESNGREMTYTLAIVDEGLLGLTRYQTPNPWDEFFKREALGVKTWDLYNFVAGAYGGKLEQLLAIGGDEEAMKPKEKANRFPPMVIFEGPFTLKKGKTDKHTINMPQYIGAVRVMAVAGSKTAFGCAEKSVTVKKPLMILATLPRVLGPAEEVSLPVSVFALEDKIKNVNVSIACTGPIGIVGESKKSCTFSAKGDQMVTFTLKTKEAIGPTTVTVTAEGNGEKVIQTINLEIRVPETPVTDVYESTLSPSQKWSQKFAYRGLDGTKSAWIEFSRIQPINLGERLNYLLVYPHGCIEQTTSSVFPQVHLKEIMELSQEQKTRIENNIKAGISRLASFQLSSGGFSYWPGQNEVSNWGTNYAGHFLVEAQMAGYYVPQSMIKAWTNYQHSAAQNWSSDEQLDQAYRLYTLALAQSPDLGAMNRLKESSSLIPAAKWRLAAAYELTGHSQVAKDLVKGLDMNVKKYRETGNTYGSDTRDKAMILETLVLMKEFEKSKPVSDQIAKDLCTNNWYSTQETAYMLLAMSRYALSSVQAGDISVKWSYNGSKETTSESNAFVTKVDLPVHNEQEGNVSVVNTSKSNLYVRLITQGVPLPTEGKKVSNGLEVYVTYLDEEGNALEPDEIAQGTDFTVEVSVTNNSRNGNLEEIALTHLFPSGWEIRNDRLDGASSEEYSKFDYQDVRDDRVYTYFDIKSGENKTFRYRLNASYIGSYYLPTVNVEAMYDVTINGREPGKWVKVVAGE